MRHAAIALLLMLGQQQAQRPAFEVATIKRNTSLAQNGTAGFGAGARFRATNIDVLTLVRIAYGTGPSRMLPSQIVGGPAWMSSDSYDITAKVADDLAGKSQAELIAVQPALLQSLLEDRFKLKIHRETRELAVYALVRARQDRGLGPQLRPSRLDCNVDFSQCAVHAAPGQFASGGAAITSLVNYLASAVVQRRVIDRTGLDGRFEIMLQWTPDRTPLPLNGDAPPAASADAPSIFAALQEQLGLKLESERGPVEVVVIDHVERPTEN
jgi:uncharacterized protein (TIGR03435 family)